jgi:hypothetical protein
VALRSQRQLPAVGNLWVGEGGARRQEALGGKPSSLGRQKCVGVHPWDPVVMESCPTAPLVVVEAKLVFHLLEVSLNAPAQLDETDEILGRAVSGALLNLA